MTLENMTLHLKESEYSIKGIRECILCCHTMDSIRHRKLIIGTLVSHCSYTHFISDLKPIWLGGVECTYRLDGTERGQRVVVEVLNEILLNV